MHASACGERRVRGWEPLRERGESRGLTRRGSARRERGGSVGRVTKQGKNGRSEVKDSSARES
eukprot:6199844-Pleurochrysis_carterae.AAC.2